MGSSKSKVAQPPSTQPPTPEKSHTTHLVVTSMGFVVSASSGFLQAAGYEFRDICQKHLVDLLLTGVLGRLHKSVYLEKFRKSIGKERARLRVFIKLHMKSIMCTICTPLGDRKVFVSTTELSNGELRVDFEFCSNSRLTAGNAARDNIPPMLRDCPITMNPTFEANNVGIIAMDVCGSTQYMVETGISP